MLRNRCERTPSCNPLAASNAALAAARMRCSARVAARAAVTGGSATAAPAFSPATFA